MIKINHQGRLGNMLLQDVGASILSKKYNLKVLNYWNNYGLLSPKLNFNGLNFTNNIFNFNNYDDKCLLDLDLHQKKFEGKIGINLSTTFQSKKFILDNTDKIKDHFNLNYQNTKDQVFVHVRLGDVKSKNPGFEYYDFCLQNIKFNFGCISSDSPEHPIVEKLCKKYKLILYDEYPSDTIYFAKNFDNLVLSGGTFSWWIGFLSKANTIFYPKNYTNWCGNIFIFDEWFGI